MPRACKKVGEMSAQFTEILEEYSSYSSNGEMIGLFPPGSAMLTGRAWGQGRNALAAVTHHMDRPALPTPLVPPTPTFAKMRGDV